MISVWPFLADRPSVWPSGRGPVFTVAILFRHYGCDEYNDDDNHNDGLLMACVYVCVCV